MKECEDYCLVIVSRVQQCCYISNRGTFCTVRVYVNTHLCTVSQVKVVGYVQEPKKSVAIIDCV